MERCLACEAVVSRAEGGSGGMVGCALRCEAAGLVAIERRSIQRGHSDIPLLTTASQARQRSTGGDPVGFASEAALNGSSNLLDPQPASGKIRRATTALNVAP